METAEALGWKLLVGQKEIEKANQLLADKINIQFKGKNLIIVCVLKGAVYFFVDLTRKITVEHSQYFIEASSYKNAQTQSEEVELLSKIIPNKFDNKVVLLLDELYDNGATMYNVKNKIMQSTSVLEKDIYTCTLFMKNKETEYPKPDLYGLTICNVWVVGYGLDDQQTKRNWVNLYAVPKPPTVLLGEDDQLFTDTNYYNNMLQNIRNQLPQPKQQSQSGLVAYDENESYDDWVCTKKTRAARY